MKGCGLRKLLDEQARTVLSVLSEEMEAYEKLVYLTGYLLRILAENAGYDELLEAFSSEAVLDISDGPFREKVFSLMEEGQKRGEFIRLRQPSQLGGFYMMHFRSILEQWCLEEGAYDLESIGRDQMEFFLQNFWYKG